MLSATSKRLQPLNVGANVAIPVPEVDKGQAEFRNILGVITTVTDDGLYEIGTRTGNLKQKYTRGEVIPAKNTFMNAQDVPEAEASLQ